MTMQADLSAGIIRFGVSFGVNLKTGKIHVVRRSGVLEEEVDLKSLPPWMQQEMDRRYRAMKKSYDRVRLSPEEELAKLQRELEELENLD